MRLEVTSSSCALHLPARQPHELVRIGTAYVVFIPSRQHAVAKATLDATTQAEALAEMRQMGLGEETL